LAFNHGPWGRSSCLDLLCGPDKWKDRILENSTHCKRICRFRRSTIELIRGVGPAVEPSKRLGTLLRNAINEDLLAPVVQFNLYYSLMLKFPKMRFDADDFFHGMDIKVSRFLRHVDKCVKEYGEENVIVDSLE